MSEDVIFLFNVDALLKFSILNGWKPGFSAGLGITRSLQPIGGVQSFLWCYYAHRFLRCFRFSSMASCRAASIAAFAHCMPKKSSSVSLQELRAAFLTKYRAEGKIITYPRASTVAQSLTLLWKFARHSSLSRISADKRFLMYFHYIPLRLTPDRGWLGKELSLLAWSVRRSVITKLQKFNNLSKLRIWLFKV